MTAVDERPPPVQPGRRPVSAKTAYQRHRRAQIKAGTWAGLRPSDTARAHIEALLASGLSLESIAELAGLPIRTLRSLARPTGRRKATTITSFTEAAVLSLRVDPARLSPHRMIDGTGTRRRLQALAVMGWPIPMLAADMGSSTTAVTHWRKAPLVIARTAVTVRGAYNRHAMRQGPSEIASARTATPDPAAPAGTPHSSPRPGSPSPRRPPT